MRKVVSILIIFITFFIIYFLQANFFNWFNIAGIEPNLFIILALFIGIFIGKVYGMAIGIVLGILLDLFIGKVIGINGIMLGIAGLLRRNTCKKFLKK